MTMQVRDAMHFEDERWSLWGAEGKGLFDPSNYGIEPRGGSTACYRGFCCTYRLHEGFLQLQELNVTVDEASPPCLNGCLPKKHASHAWGPCGDSTYRDVQLPLAFTGGLLLCRDWVKPFPFHIGPELAWVFENIRELIFERGELVEHHDHSREIAKVREEVAANDGEIVLEKSVAKEDETWARYQSIEAKINACFIFNY